MYEGSLKKESFFYITSYPRSGNTWVVNSLKDYLGAQRGEISPSVYNGDEIELQKGINIKIAGKYNPDLPVGIKTHLDYDTFVKKNVAKNNVVYLLRDARDVMLSYFFYLYGFLEKEVEKVSTFSEKEFFEFLRERLPEYRKHVKGWIKHEDVLLIKYEDLHKEYKQMLIKIKYFLGVENQMSEDDVKDRYVDSFKEVDGFKNVLQGNNLDFYRKGVIGDWKNYFTEKHKSCVKNEVGDLLIELGYEKDMNWS